MTDRLLLEAAALFGSDAAVDASDSSETAAAVVDPESEGRGRFFRVGALSPRRWAQDYLAEQWGTEALLPDDMVGGGMVNVRLPLASLAGGRELQRLLRATHDMELLIFELRGYTGRAGRIWARVCTQVYLDKGDVEALAAAVLQELPAAMRVDDALTFAA